MQTSKSDSRSTVVGVFRDPDAARQGIARLKDAGFSGDDVSVLSPDHSDSQAIADETGTHAGGGAATGAVAGGLLGGIGGWLVGIGALAIPGVGPFIAAGAFATALGGAAIGAGVGAIAGALVGMGVPEEHARYYEDEVRGGRTLVTVVARGRYDEAESILHGAGAYDVEHPEGESYTPMTSDTRDSDHQPATRNTGETTVQLREEELHAETRPVETGQVVVGKRVVTETRDIEVPVSHEEAFIERRPVERRGSDQPIDASSETVAVPLRAEEIHVEKKPVVYEEVGVGKREVTESQHVEETVRREEARVERTGADQGEPTEPRV